MENFNLKAHLAKIYSSFPEAEHQPLIGITCNYVDGDAALRDRYYMQVVAAGGTPVLIPPVADKNVLINTLEHHARGYQNDEHDSDRYDDRRLAWYRERYDAIPLWVLFSDLTFGNLRYFFALMRRAEQRVVCERLREACGTTAQGQTLTPKALLHDLEALGLLRNCCAHEERIYNATFGTDELTYLQMLERLAAFLADEDEERLYRAVNTLVKRFGEMSPRVQTALANAGF